MARSFNGSSQYAQSGGAPVTAYPFTVSCWVTFASLPPYNTGSSDIAVTVGSSAYNGAGGGSLAWIDLLNDSSGVNFRVVVIDAAGNALAKYRTLTPTLDVWYHLCGLFVNSSTCDIQVNAAYPPSGGGFGSGINLSNTDYIAVGAYTTTGVGTGNFHNGKAAETAVWNVILNDDEIAQLAKGFSPDQIRPQSLKFYAPLIGRTSPEIDAAQGLSLTLNNAPSQAEHPRVIYPKRKQTRRFMTAADGGGGFFSRVHYDQIGRSNV